MTDQEWQDLGRRAVACKHWRWMPGMLARYSADAWYRTSEVDSVGIPVRVRPPNPRSAWPDLRDPATLGCLLALVREAYADGGALWGGRVEVHQDHRTVFTAVIAYHKGNSLAHRALAISGRNDAEALVAALEVAP